MISDMSLTTLEKKLAEKKTKLKEIEQDMKVIKSEGVQRQIELQKAMLELSIKSYEAEIKKRLSKL